MTDQVEVYELPWNGTTIFGIICDDEKLPMFQEAAHLMQEALDISGNDFITRRDGRLDEPADWAPDLFSALAQVDELSGSPWRLWTLASIVEGRHKGLTAVGIGSNQKKKLRAANLALAYSFARSERTEGSAGLQYMVSVVQCKTLSHLPPLPVPKVVVPRSPSVHSHSAPPSPPQLALTYPSSKTVGDEAKRRLIAWRRQKPSLTEAQHHVVSSLCRNRLPEEFAGLDSNVVRDLELVLEHDHWKGSPAGIQWVKSWLAWADPFTNPSKHWFGRTQEKREAAYWWYHGECAETPSRCKTFQEYDLNPPPPPPPVEHCDPLKYDAPPVPLILPNFSCLGKPAQLDEEEDEVVFSCPHLTTPAEEDEAVCSTRCDAPVQSPWESMTSSDPMQYQERAKVALSPCA